MTVDTFAQSHLQHCHPVGLALHGGRLKVYDLSAGEEDLKVAVATGSDGDDVFDVDTILEDSLSFIVDMQMKRIYFTCKMY